MSLAPEPDGHSASHWAALAGGHVVLQECGACGARTMPLTPTCPRCGSADVADVESPGTGSIYSYVTVHRTGNEVFAGEVPYTVATVDLDGGGRCFGRVVPVGSVAIGARVVPRFHRHESWAELRFEIEGGT